MQAFKMQKYQRANQKPLQTAAGTSNGIFSPHQKAGYYSKLVPAGPYGRLSSGTVDKLCVVLSIIHDFNIHLTLQS